MKYQELKDACRGGKAFYQIPHDDIDDDIDTVDMPLSNNWQVRVKLVAKRTLFYLIDPKGRQFGGDDAMNTFVPWAMKFMEVK